MSRTVNVLLVLALIAALMTAGATTFSDPDETPTTTKAAPKDGSR